MSEERVRQLSCWTTPDVEVVPLAGGITNRNFSVRDGARWFVVRQCSEGSHLGIDRRNERACHTAAAEIGVAPAIQHVEAEFLVCDFVSGITLTADDLRDSDRLLRVARSLKSVHHAWPQLTGEMLYFSVFQTVRTYAQSASRGNARLPLNLSLVLDDVRGLEASLEPFRPVLCHNDLLPANLIDDGRSVAIVDWELAGMGHPLFDLAGVISNAALPDELADQFVLAYGLEPHRIRRELRLFQALSLLREALWGSVQSVHSTLDVDYQAYAETHFARYREARSRVS